MKKAKVKIKRLPGFEDSPEEAEGWRLEHVAGLVAHRRWRLDKESGEWKQSGEWIVTHEGSGSRVGGHPPNSVVAPGFAKRDDAFTFMEILDLLADWTRPAEELVDVAGLKDRVYLIHKEVMTGV